ncbi:unnamed protein product [Lactuca saligna]|uniref:Uncharacterized protein n=1 Tax=Lactuca saligna TaxID=75948 RepID=A0AA36A1U1_LACSI|nr:unnamed protein product [Lactuca saligna]
MKSIGENVPSPFRYEDILHTTPIMEGSNDEEEYDDLDDDYEEPPQIDEVILKILSISRVHSSSVSSSDAGFSGGGLLIQLEMQHSSMNMVAGAQNVNGVAVNGPEEYLGI